MSIRSAAEVVGWVVVCAAVALSVSVVAWIAYSFVQLVLQTSRP